MRITNTRTMTARIELGHGSGGLMTGKLIRDIFMKYFDNEYLNACGDSAIIGSSGEYIAVTTDSYVIDPIFFPGGDLGKLAVCGTVNDLAVAGAVPAAITAGFILEEGLPLTILEDIVKSMKRAADEADIDIVAGDTKVVGKGQADKIFINTSGIGFLEEKNKDLASGNLIREGDVLLVNGTLGDHEATIINAREKFFEESGLRSDCTPLNFIIRELTDRCHVHFMRDITRGGLAGILNEIAGMTGMGIEITEKDLPLNDSVKFFCETLGYDPLHLANEGKFITIVDFKDADTAAEILHNHYDGTKAARIGRIIAGHQGYVVMETFTGGSRIVESPWTAMVPRIC